MSDTDSPTTNVATVEAPPPEPPRQPMVAVREVVKDYGETLALKGVSFDVERGEIFGLIGPNGAGKTTTIRILATLLEPTSGEVRIGGHCVENDAEKVRSIIGYMPDAFGVYEGNTVEEYLEFFAAAYRVPQRSRRAVVEDVMTLTDLTGLRARMVADLSRGMKQRLCLAKTLVHDPQVMILDEPASALDPRARVEMRALLKELSRMGKTILISSHILTELSDLCTGVAILERGQLVESGSQQSIQNKRSRGYRVKVRLHSTELVEERGKAKELLQKHPQVADIEADPDVTFTYLGEPEKFYEVIKLLADAALPIVSVEPEVSNLENLFMELTEGDVQ